ncbi:hypothetical protein [Paraburkholderia lycopersici]|uniref:hypothetical protein n=1 Tax=Paraburkholderia lycopersici TaxID=416944 RepID=UPI0011613421|nr:hypothetical protein [Paraburkholderia lycopersici]
MAYAPGEHHERLHRLHVRRRQADKVTAANAIDLIFNQSRYLVPFELKNRFFNYPILDFYREWNIANDRGKPVHSQRSRGIATSSDWHSKRVESSATIEMKTGNRCSMDATYPGDVVSIRYWAVPIWIIDNN